MLTLRKYSHSKKIERIGDNANLLNYVDPGLSKAINGNSYF